jgi:molybdenum cofactor synthesis domain-containing protein
VKPITVAVLTVSDRCARGEAQDASGSAVAELVQRALGAQVVAKACVPDEAPTISAQIKAWARGDVQPDLILTTGGTGLSPRDVTPEATLAVLERRHPGLLELARLRCYATTPRAYLSRGEAARRAARRHGATRSAARRSAPCDRDAARRDARTRHGGVVTGLLTVLHRRDHGRDGRTTPPANLQSPISNLQAAAALPLRFTWTELSGSLGDMGTFLPLVLAMSLACGIDFGAILVWAGLMNIFTGWCFRQPVPVQPMKAIAAVAIAEHLQRGALVAGGTLMGVVLVVLAASGAVGWAARHVPKPIVRGIQLGIGLKLAWTAGGWLFAAGMPAGGFDSWLVAAVCGLLLLPRLQRIPMLLLVFVGGFMLLFAAHADALATVRFGWPRFELIWPVGADWAVGLTRLVIPQLPLTLLNSVIAVCALSESYYPARGIPPARMALSVGAMNLVAVPLGGIPLCHGAGGLAAQHRFGARTGGSVIMLGVAKVALGLLCGASLTKLLVLYPRSILGVLLIFAGCTLAAAARDCRRGLNLVLVLLTAGGIVLLDTASGVLIGVGALLAVRAVTRIAQRARPRASAGPSAESSPAPPQC